jgi:single-stranded-DNA-specific exonuclease
MRDMGFHLKGLTLQMTMACPDIALDGIKSIDHVAYAKERNIDFIICDHHRPGKTCPKLLPFGSQRDDCSYPYDELCGCGIVN